MKNLFNIIRKEFKKFFSNPRMIISLILPAVLIFAFYTLLGKTVLHKNKEEQLHCSWTICNSTPEMLESMKTFTKNATYEIDFTHTTLKNVEEAKENVAKNKTDLLIIMPENFNELISSEKENEIPEIQIFYNSISTKSANSYNLSFNYFYQFENFLVNKFNVNSSKQNYDLNENQDNLLSNVLASILPFMLLTFICNSCLSIAPDSIAGEKERGTLATILVTPIKRWELALGKIISISVFSSLGAISGFIGVMASMPSIMDVPFNKITTLFPFSRILLLLIAVIIAVPIIVSIISVISAYAKNIREASSMSMVLIVICMGLGILSIIGLPHNTLLYFVPMLNSSLIISSIISNNFILTDFLISIASNILFTVVFLVILIKMFNNEKILYN